MKALISKICNAIIYGKKCGQSGRTIAKQLKCGKMAVYKVLQHLHETDFSLPKKWTGSSPLLNTPSRQELKAFV